MSRVPKEYNSKPSSAELTTTVYNLKITDAGISVIHRKYQQTINPVTAVRTMFSLSHLSAVYQFWNKLNFNEQRPGIGSEKSLTH
jgi:hypothetical protein